MVERIRSGKLRISHANIIELSRLLIMNSKNYMIT